MVERQSYNHFIREAVRMGPCCEGPDDDSTIVGHIAITCHTRPPSGPRTITSRSPFGGIDNRRFAAVMAWGRRPVPFRTRKLRPSTAMVLHSTGCGRVARRRITRNENPRMDDSPPGGSPIPRPRPRPRPQPDNDHDRATTPYAARRRGNPSRVLRALRVIGHFVVF